MKPLSAAATKTALFSSSAKPPELRAFASELYDRGWNILASAGTAKFLNEGGTKYAKDVASLVGEPILGHKVVTLSRELYTGLLADLGDPEDVVELKRVGVNPINLVYVDLYPLEKELGKPDATYESVIKQTDIGGPTMLRAAAKGGRIVLVNPGQFPDTMQYLQKELDETITDIQRRSFLSTLAKDAEKTVMLYGGLSYRFHKRVSDTGQFP